MVRWEPFRESCICIGGSHFPALRDTLREGLYARLCKGAHTHTHTHTHVHVEACNNWHLYQQQYNLLSYIQQNCNIKSVMNIWTLCVRTVQNILQCYQIKHSLEANSLFVSLQKNTEIVSFKPQHHTNSHNHCLLYQQCSSPYSLQSLCSDSLHSAADCGNVSARSHLKQTSGTNKLYWTLQLLHET